MDTAQQAKHSPAALSIGQHGQYVMPAIHPHCAERRENATFIGMDSSGRLFLRDDDIRLPAGKRHITCCSPESFVPETPEAEAARNTPPFVGQSGLHISAPTNVGEEIKLISATIVDIISDTAVLLRADHRMDAIPAGGLFPADLSHFVGDRTARLTQVNDPSRNGHETPESDMGSLRSQAILSDLTDLDLGGQIKEPSRE